MDRANGVVHHETFRRSEIEAMFANLGLFEMRVAIIDETSDDPRDPEIQNQLDPVFDRYIQRAAGHPELQERGEELRRRTAEIGFHSAASLLALGRKAVL